MLSREDLRSVDRAGRSDLATWRTSRPGRRRRNEPPRHRQHARSRRACVNDEQFSSARSSSSTMRGGGGASPDRARPRRDASRRRPHGARRRVSENPLLREALRLAAIGYRVFPLGASSKKPLPGSRGVHDASADADTLREWWQRNPGSNIGLACGDGLVVIDLDPPACRRRPAIARLRRRRRPSATTRGRRTCSSASVRTWRRQQRGRGARRRYQGSGRYVVVALASSTPRKASTALPGADPRGPRVVMPKCPSGSTRSSRNGAGPGGRPRSRLTPTRKSSRARRYLAMRAAVSAGGHAALLCAARACVVGFALDDATTFRLLADHYNPRCDPPWSGAELERDFRHKINQARTTPFNKPVGYLLSSHTKRRAGVDISGIMAQRSRAAWRPPSRPRDHAPLPSSAIWSALGHPARKCVGVAEPARSPSSRAIRAREVVHVLDIIARVTRKRLWPDRWGMRPWAASS